MPARFDIAIIGAGAAGLFAAIHAGRSLHPAIGRSGRVVLLDGASRLGAKILVAGGGRCNVTHFAVSESDYSGSSPPAIRKVLGRFGVDRTIEFFTQLGVHLKREETGKLFPITDDAHTVLNSLLGAAAQAGVELRHPWRVGQIRRTEAGFVIERAITPAPGEHLVARRVILATGGMSLPKTGSDGAGYAFARSLGHSLTPRVFPALVPLTLRRDDPLCTLSGVSVPAEVQLRSGTGKRLYAWTDSLLFTHFGLSGPAALNLSRHLTTARMDDPGAHAAANFTPGMTPEELHAALLGPRQATVLRWITEQLPRRTAVPEHPDRGMPERVARVLCAAAQVEPSSPLQALTKERRSALVRALTELPLHVTGDRGFTYAEVTAGGIPLAEVRLDTMESRKCPGLHLCGEILDVDGRLGGFNFQWAWASGFTAGVGAARLTAEEDASETSTA